MATRLTAARSSPGCSGSQPAAPHPRYQDLAARIRMLLVDGRLVDGIRLPSERSLADGLGLSRTTVAAAYARLRDAGFVEARPGSGNVTAWPRGQPTTTGGGHAMPEGVISDDVTPPVAAPVQVATAFGRALERMRPAARRPRLPARGPAGAAGADRGPVRGPRTADPTGPDRHHHRRAGGAQPGAAHRARSRRPGCWSSHRRYPNAVDAIRRAGGRGVPWPLTEEGWDPDRLEVGAAPVAHPGLAYLIPDFHNPTGRLMTGEQRATTARLLRRHGVVPVIDETMVELSLDGAGRGRRSPPAPPTRSPSARPARRTGVGCGSAGSARRASWSGRWSSSGPCSTWPPRCSSSWC